MANTPKCDVEGCNLIWREWVRVGPRQYAQVCRPHADDLDAMGYECLPIRSNVILPPMRKAERWEYRRGRFV